MSVLLFILLFILGIILYFIIGAICAGISQYQFRATGCDIDRQFIGALTLCFWPAAIVIDILWLLLLRGMCWHFFTYIGQSLVNTGYYIGKCLDFRK